MSKEKFIELAYFQFHKGAIETLMPGLVAGRGPRFQFHKGAIETLMPGLVAGRGPRFQFHKGAIETLAIDNTPNDIITFNSIKVRLKLLPDARPGARSGFQFHKGAIETLFWYRAWL